jgi:hypothetical protein
MSMRRMTLLCAGLLAAPGLAGADTLSPLQTVERLHRAMFEADPVTIKALLHPEYHGISLQGPREHRHIYTESREKAVSDVAKLKPHDWEVRFLKTSTQTDPNGMAHVWARYVLHFKGIASHCGFESYGLYRDNEGWRVISFADTDNPLQGRSVDDVCPDA